MAESKVTTTPATPQKDLARDLCNKRKPGSSTEFSACNFNEQIVQLVALQCLWFKHPNKKSSGEDLRGLGSYLFPMASSPGKQPPPSLEKLWDGTVSLHEYNSYMESKENTQGGVESEPQKETEHVQTAPQEPRPQQQQKQDDKSGKNRKKMVNQKLVFYLNQEGYQSEPCLSQNPSSENLQFL